MQKDGGEGTRKVPRISLSLLALKTETEGGDGFGTWLILLVFKDYSFYIETNGPNYLLYVTNRLGFTGRYN